MIAEIDAASEDYLMNTDIDEWVAYLVGQYEVEVQPSNRTRWK